MSLLDTILAWFRCEVPPAGPPLPPVSGDREALFRALREQHDRALADVAQELDPDAQRLLRTLMNDRRFREIQRDD